MKKLYYYALLYLYLPILLFILGWTKIWIGIPVAAVSAVGIYYAIQKLNIAESRENFWKKGELVVFFLLFFAVCVFCGGGDLFPQDYDWSKHHAILRDLVNYRWPVVYDEDAMLTYYLGQYIVPAFVGKVLGQSMFVAVWAQTAWNAAGLLLAFCFICHFVKADTLAKRIGVFAIIFFWGGATSFGSKVYQKMGHEVTLMSFKWIDFGRVLVHFASNFDALRGAFQHVIVPWICCGIFMQNVRKIEVYVLLALPLFFSSTFGFVYFAVILISCAVVEFCREKDVSVFKRLFSKSNLLLLPVTAVFVIYYIGNIFGEKPDMVGFEIINMAEHWHFYLVFIAVEFMGYAVFVFWNNRRNVLYYIVVIELLLIPFLSMGMFNDLCSRGSIPARFILMVWCIQQLYQKGWKNVWNALVMCVLILAAWNTYDEVKEVCRLTNVFGLQHEEMMWDHFGTLNGMAGNSEVRGDEAYNYYTLEYSDSLFYKIAR